MNFLELLQALEHRLGYQHLPLSPQAPTLKQIFECSPVHHDLMHRLVHALYAANGCHQLTDPVQRSACFEAVGPVRQQALKTADIDAHRLLEDFCRALDDIFAAEYTPTPETTPTKSSADVIPLAAFRRRR